MRKCFPADFYSNSSDECPHHPFGARIMGAAAFAGGLAALPVMALAQNTHVENFAPAQQLTIKTSPFQADVALQCSFTKECFEAENCADTTFAAEIDGAAGGLGPAEMVVEANLITDAETTEIIGVRSADAYSLSGGSFDARHLISIAATGDIRYTLHLADGPMAITYHGLCKGQN